MAAAADGWCPQELVAPRVSATDGSRTRADALFAEAQGAAAADSAATAAAAARVRWCQAGALLSKLSGRSTAAGGAGSCAPPRLRFFQARACKRRSRTIRAAAWALRC